MIDLSTTRTDDSRTNKGEEKKKSLIIFRIKEIPQHRKPGGGFLRRRNMTAVGGRVSGMTRTRTEVLTGAILRGEMQLIGGSRCGIANNADILYRSQNEAVSQKLK